MGPAWPPLVVGSAEVQVEASRADRLQHTLNAHALDVEFAQPPQRLVLGVYFSL